MQNSIEASLPQQNDDCYKQLACFKYVCYCTLKLITWVFLGFSVIFSSHLSAQVPPPLDLALRVESFPPMPVPLNSFVTIRWTVKNNSATHGVIGEIYFLPPVPPNVGTIDAFAPTNQRDCGQCFLGAGNCIQTPVIEAGQEGFCELYYDAVQYNGNPGNSRQRVFHIPGSWTDPNPSNAEVRSRIGIQKPEPIQVPLSPLSYGLMGMLVIAFGALAARKS